MTCLTQLLRPVSFLPALLVGSVALGASADTGVPRSQHLLTIAAVGDIMMGTNYPQNALPDDQGAGLFRNSRAEMQKADIRFGNLEGPLFDGQAAGDGKSSGANRWIFRTPTIFGNSLAAGGFNVVSVANNHSHDFGHLGFASTEATLKRDGIQYSGKDGSLASFQIQGVRAVLIAVDFYPGRRSLSTPESTFDEIRELKKTAQIVIVYAHAGGEGEEADHVVKGPEYFLGENRGDSVTFAHRAIDAGADLILMSGPHVPRAVEVHQGHLIVYSLGNFLTERGISISGKSALAPMVIVQIDHQGRFVHGHLDSFQQSRNQGLVVDPGEQAFRLISHLSEVDFPETHPDFEANGDFTAAPNSHLP